MKKVTTQRVKQSMWSMLVGRPLSALGGFAVLLLLSRHLPAAEYGQYFSVWAMAEIVILASNIGLIHAVYRYVSADERLDGVLTPHGPVWQLVGWRVLSLLPAVLLPLVPAVAGWLGQGALAPQLVWSLGLIIAGEGLARFLEAIFDSMLCQGRSQITLVSRTALRLLGYGWLVSSGQLHLGAVLLVEVVATLGGAVLGLGLLAAVWRGAAHEHSERLSWRAMAGFALPAYIAQLLTLTYGPDALKLILAAVAGPAALALFGFAFSLAAVVQRYIPVNLLAGVFRPVFVSAAKKPDAAAVLSSLIGMSIKVSWLMILPILCFLWSGGSPALAAISGGNYAAAGPVVTTVVLGLLMIAVHLTLSMYCLAIAVSWPMLGATVCTVLVLPLAAPLAREYGAWGIAVVFLLTEAVWCAGCYYLLRRLSGGALQLDWRGLARLLGAAGVAVLCGQALARAGLHWLPTAALSGLASLALAWYWMPFSARERGWLAAILPGGQRLFGTAAAAPEPRPVQVADAHD